MAVSIAQINSILNIVSHEISQAYEGLTLFFIPHGIGKLRESVSLAEHEIISHRASNAARAILRKHSGNDKSSFMGLAIASEKKYLGLKRIDHIMGLININTDEFETEDEARAKIYHLSWHAIDLYEIRKQPEYAKKFRNGPVIPKRSPMNAAKANLQADSFAISYSSLKKENNLIDFISERRALSSLMPISNFKPEEFPSAIAMEACKMALNEYSDGTSQNISKIKLAHQISTDVGHTFDEDNIRQWWNFSIPAQDMAWRGYSKEMVLGAAIHTSSDPYVRSVGYLIQEMTGVEPAPAEALEGGYNAFIDPELLTNLHKEMVDTIFEDAVSRGLNESSNRAFLNAANKLNESLTEGQILGWCSNALQDAAHAFERALLNGASPDQAARMHFEGNKSHPKWETLKELGKSIVDQKRQGFAVTMGHIAEICHNNPAFAPVLDSLKITINDPAYVQKLQAANDLNVIPNMATPAPFAPTPKGPAPKGPAPQAPAMGPSLGGNNRAQQIMYQRQMAARNAEKESSSQDENK